MQVTDLISGYQSLKDKYNKFIGETEGRINAGYAGSNPIDQFRAYAQALGPQNVRLNNDTVEINKGSESKPQWSVPDEGIDVRDFTTDLEPELPSMVGGALGAIGGIKGAVLGAELGDIGRQAIGKKKGLRDASGYSESEAKLAGAGELMGPLITMLPVPNVAALTAYHGSPHVFDKFDMSKIGTGEGSQAYGHGLYFAENPEVAKNYAADRAYVGKYIDTGIEGPEHTIEKLAQDAMDVAGDAQKAADHLRKVLKANSYSKNPAQAVANAKVQKSIDMLESGEITKKGNLYTVDIPDEYIDRMLDWDKPLSEQSEYVKKALAKIDPNFHNAKVERVIKQLESNANDSFNILVDGGKFEAINQDTGAFAVFDTYEKAVEWLRPQIEKKIGGNVNVRGEDIFRDMHTKNGGDYIGRASVSGQLREAGIHGIKYLDRTSRTAGEGTRNFVLFDDQIPKILKRE
jgi:hypothetical protein